MPIQTKENNGDKDKKPFKIGRLELPEAIVVALIAGIFGLLGSIVQLSVAKPATEGSVAAFFNKQLPIGTIVASVIGPQNFVRFAGDKPGFDPRNSTWVPADGRDVSGSLYAGQVSSLVPDLRGMFLRGLNWSEPERVRTGEWADPDGKSRVVGEGQMDEVGEHSHPYVRLMDKAGVPHLVTNPDDPRALGIDTVNSQNTGGRETRPKNAAVYYYIKIN